MLNAHSLATSKLYAFKPMLGPAEEWPEGSVEWAERISNRLQINTQSVTKTTAHNLRDVLKQIYRAKPRPWEIWPEDRPVGTPDDYCLLVTGHSWDTLLSIVEELTGDPELNVYAMQAENARAQVEHKVQGAHSDYSTVKRGSTSKDHLLRRLARDHPDILDRFEIGEFPSVRAAAREAGLIKEPTPFEQVKKLLKKLTDAERRQLKDLL